jgi:hypothetical protein
MPIEYKTHPVSPGMRMDNLGAFITRGGAITLDAYLPNDEIFKVLFCTTGGVVRVEGIDGNTFEVNLQDNGGAPIVGRRVLTAGTTAAGLKWCGGI